MMAHFLDLMVLASSYNWSAVRAYHYKVLQATEMGLARWGQSFDCFKQPFFLPTALLSESPAKPCTKLVNRANQSGIPRRNICDAWSWHNDCSASDCPKFHVCIVCKESDHQAINCPKRKYDIPQCRNNQTPRN